MSEHAETVRQYADDLSLNRGIPSGDLHAAADHIEQLEAIVERLPKTADGVPVVPGGAVWWPHDDRDFGEGPHEMEVSPFWKWSSEQEDWEDDECGIAVPCFYGYHDWVSRDLRDCYSTREAAEAARQEGGDG